MLLHSDVPRYLDQLKACRQLIFESPLAAECGTYAIPVECDEVLNCLESMDVSVSKIRDLVKSTKEQQLSDLPNRSKLLMYLYAADNHVHTAMLSVEQFRPLCMSKNAKAAQEQARVQGELRNLMHACEKIEREAEMMLDFLLLKA